MVWISRYEVGRLVWPVSIGSIALLGCVFDPTLSVLHQDAVVDRGRPGDAAAPDVLDRDGGPDAGPRCQGTCTSCLELGDRGTCRRARGCRWARSFCGGTCTECSRFTEASSCGHQAGCTWQEQWACGGGCRACSTYGDEPSCGRQHGCSWQPASCSGTPVSCDQFSVDDCESQPGCEVEGGRCTGLCTATGVSINVCLQAGCLAVCVNDICDCGGSCAPSADPAQCTAAGCVYSSGSCSGNAEACAGRSHDACNNGCSWSEARCTGTCTPCSAFGDEPACASQAGCTWQSVGGSCGGSCRPCDQFERTGCSSQLGCAWQTAGCAGTCEPCGRFTDRASCEAQPGCSWSP